MSDSKMLRKMAAVVIFYLLPDLNAGEELSLVEVLYMTEEQAGE
jgi:hypothetical protein